MAEENSINEGYNVIKISSFLSTKEYSNKKLVIPNYQRPYR